MTLKFPKNSWIPVFLLTAQVLLMATVGLDYKFIVQITEIMIKTVTGLFLNSL